LRIPDDLHPDDAATRRHLIDALRSSRQTRHLTYARVGQHLGISGTAIRTVEDRTTWQGPTVMRYARAIGWRIEWRIHGLELPDDGDVMALVLAAGTRSSPELADRVHWKCVCYDLVRIRRAMTTGVDMARRLGVSENAVHYWEGNFEGSSVISAQRHARALGGAFDWEIYPSPSPLVALVPLPRTA
jgi:hypothetical protein